MKVDELALLLNLPVEDMVSIGQSQATNPNSAIYKAILAGAVKKIAAVKAVSDADKKVRNKNRVYIQHVVEPSHRYTLVSTFPNWDIKFVNESVRSASLARAVFTLTAEYLYSKVKPQKGNVLAWGVGITSVVMRSRHWVHLCVPGHEVATQHDHRVEDRSIVAMVNASLSRGKDPGFPAKYASERVVAHCTTPSVCTFKATAGIMMLHRTDTNFRQVAMWMLQHDVTLTYFAVQGGKHLELCTAGPLPELDAYVLPQDDGQRIDVAYKGDVAMTQSFTYSNYLELVARSEVRINGMIFRKEYDNSFLGMLVFKVTCFPEDVTIPPEPVIYRSWVEPKYKDQYMMYAPVLRPGGMVSNKTDWSLTAFPLDIGLVDEVHEAAMRAQGTRDLQGFIARKLNSRTSNVVILNQVVQRNKLMAVTLFDLVVLMIYCSVFMQKYKDGQAVATLAPHARDVAALSRHGMLGTFTLYARALQEIGAASFSSFTSSVRKLYYAADSTKDLPMPSFLIEPGYVVYGDTASSNPRFTSWDTPGGDPTFGFYPGLPGMKFKRVFSEQGLSTLDTKSLTDTATTFDPLLFATGDAYLDAASGCNIHSRVTVRDKNLHLREEAEDGLAWMTNVASSVFNIFTSVKDHEVLVQDRPSIEPLPASFSGGLYQPEKPPRSDRVQDVPVEPRYKSHSQAVSSIVNKVLNDNHRLVTTGRDPHTTRLFANGEVPDIIPGFYSDDPRVDIVCAIGKIFPKSMTMNTQFFESDKFYSDTEYFLKGNRLKVDLSKIMPLRPEKFFLPMIRGHVNPDLKKTTTNTLYTMQKRNANTPDSSVSLDPDRLVEDAFRAYLKVFCKEGTEEVLKNLPYDGPDEDAVREWVSRLPETKKTKLESQEGYDLVDISLANNTLMLKSKLKPNLGASYTTAIKAAQSIQYDATGKSTAVLSPVIARKVEREQQVLKYNVLVLQRKSIAEVNEFINQFDWRPDDRGSRYYIEGDYENFDKSQGPVPSRLHWSKCEKFGMLPALVKFLEEHNKRRSISDLQAGVKMFLDTQRGSGHPDTLDGNNDVNMMALAQLLEKILSQIEFVIFQGDDFIIAMRGPRIDTKEWEYEVTRRYNLSLKLQIHEHGYICSQDIAHLPDGHSVVVADVVKKALSFMSMSKNKEEDFPEQFTSYVDNMKYIEDLRVQKYLAVAVSRRMVKYLPGVTESAILDLCRACARLKTSYKLYRGMFADVPTTRYY